MRPEFETTAIICDGRQVHAVEVYPPFNPRPPVGQQVAEKVASSGDAALAMLIQHSVPVLSVQPSTPTLPTVQDVDKESEVSSVPADETDLEWMYQLDNLSTVRAHAPPCSCASSARVCLTGRGSRAFNWAGGGQ